MSSHSTKKPTGGVRMRRVIEPPDPNAHLLERIVSRPNMLQAWKRVQANKGAPGIDHISIVDFPDYARENWNSIRESLSDGSYQPLPVKRVEIPKSTGGKRPLGIPTVTDRLIQQAISQALTPIFDSVKELWVNIHYSRQRRDKLSEPTGADPLAGWCGG